MKHLILIAALLACATAQADTVAYATNEGGGKIQLKSERGDCKNDDRVVFSTLPNGKFLVGCWRFIGLDVYVKYSSGQERLYDLDGFTVTGKKEPSPEKQRGSML